MTPTPSRTLELAISGMDCAECTQHVRQAIAAVPGVHSVDVFLASEKALVRLDPARANLASLSRAVEDAGYSIGAPAPGVAPAGGRQVAGVAPAALAAFTRRSLSLFGLVFGAVLFIVVVGEWLGLFKSLSAIVPFPVGVLLVALTGWPIFVNVARATLRRQIIAHSLMTVGVFAALLIGEWATAAVVAFFMRVGDHAERFTTEGARRAVKDLTALAPRTARVERDGVETEVPAAHVAAGEVVVVRPGEKIPVDGVVVSGLAAIDQSTITGESMPAEAGPGARVYAATVLKSGSLRLRTTRIGPDTTFGKVVKMVEEAEAHRSHVQRFADKFTNYYLPIVALVAVLTFILRRDPLATAAVLVVACSCSIALATPMAMLASIGAGARRGLLIKGGKYLEALARADVLLIDKTGTLTLGRPQITDIVPADEEQPAPGSNGASIEHRRAEVLRLAASAEKYSEHPLAEAVRAAARAHRLALEEPQSFESLAGMGVRARVGGEQIVVGNRRHTGENGSRVGAALESQGKSLLYVTRNGRPAGLLGAADTLRPEVPAAIAALRAGGLKHIVLLTGDNERAAAALAARLGVSYRANLLPEDKIAVVRAFQSRGHTVVMVGDGVNDAPALAQADIGIAMGAAGADIALEAAHVALLQDDWSLVPELFHIARRTMGAVKANLAMSAIYNLAGLSLAAVGLLPPILAAAAQSLPDLGILANSARLLKQK